MPLSRSDTEAALLKKGFTLTETHHRFYYLLVGGQKTGVYTYVSTGKKYKELGDQLVALMAKQLHLTKKQFVELVECTLDEEGYVELLRASKVIPPLPTDT